MARNYAAIPHEYIEEMAELSDEEFGRLVRAVLLYSRSGEVPTLQGVERIVFPRVKMQEDRFQANYQDLSRDRSEAGKKGAASRWQSMANDSKTWQDVASDDSTCQGDGKNGNTETKTNTETETDIQPSNDGNVEREAPPEGGARSRKAPPKRHKYGQYGWVRLSDDEHSRLLNDLGDAELERCVTYVDESAQRTGNKNGWRDWNLVIRKCHKEQWGVSRSARDAGVQTGNPFLEMLNERRGDAL